MAEPSSESLRREVDLDVWEVDDLPDTFADDVLAAMDSGEEPQSIAPAELRAVHGRARRWIALAAGAVAAAASAALWSIPVDAPRVGAPAGIAATREDGHAQWHWISTSNASVIAEQSAGRVRWDAQRGVPLTVQTPAGSVTTTHAAFSLEVLDMSRLTRKHELVLGAAFAGTVAALVYVHAGEVRVENDLGALELARSEQAAMSEAERPRRVEDGTAAPEGEPAPKRETSTPMSDWAEARVGIREAIEARTAARKALEQAEPSSPSVDAPEVPPETLDKAYIQKTVRSEVLPLVRECYNMLLDRDPQIAGRMVLRFTIMGDEAVGGIVDEVGFGEDSEIRDPSFRECLAETMRSTVFAPPEGGGRVVVSYPFVFQTPNGESSPASKP